MQGTSIAAIGWGGYNVRVYYQADDDSLWQASTDTNGGQWNVSQVSVKNGGSFAKAGTPIAAALALNYNTVSVWPLAQITSFQSAYYIACTQGPVNIRVFTIGTTDEVVQWVNENAGMGAWAAATQTGTVFADTPLAAVWSQEANLRLYYQTNSNEIDEAVCCVVGGKFYNGSTISTDTEGSVQPA